MEINQKRMKILIVPYWLEQTLLANQLPMKAALDIMALSRILSFKDVCFYSAINMWLYEELPQAVIGTFDRVDLAADGPKYLMTDAGGLKPSIDKTAAFYQRVQNEYQYTYRLVMSDNDNSAKRLLLSLYPHDTTVIDQAAVAKGEYLFEVFDIMDDVLGIRFAVADKHVPYGKQLKDCYDKLLKVLVYRLGFKNTAKLPVFNEFARLARTFI